MVRNGKWSGITIWREEGGLYTAWRRDIGDFVGNKRRLFGDFCEDLLDSPVNADLVMMSPMSNKNYAMELQIM